MKSPSLQTIEQMKASAKIPSRRVGIESLSTSSLEEDINAEETNNLSSPFGGEGADLISALAEQITFTKYTDGLVPAIVQDIDTSKVLMLGFMNSEALNKTIETKLVTFYSRTKQRLWTKGETSKNYLHLISIKMDCDNDTLLVKVKPDGPVCHTGADTCFNEKNMYDNFLTELENIIDNRMQYPADASYTSSLFNKGINAIAQKVGEEAVELIIEAKDNDADKFKNEAADLLFHYLVLLKAKGYNLTDVIEILKKRHK